MDYRSEYLRDPTAGDGISAEQARLQNELLRRGMQLPNSQTDSTGTRMTVRRTTGSGGGLYWGMLMEDHPGDIGVCFKIILADWNSSTNGWDFDCETPEEDWETAIDYYEGVPYPEKYTMGHFERRASDTTASGYIYVVVDLSCTSHGLCESLTGSNCGEE